MREFRALLQLQIKINVQIIELIIFLFASTRTLAGPVLQFLKTPISTQFSSNKVIFQSRL